MSARIDSGTVARQSSQAATTLEEIRENLRLIPRNGFKADYRLEEAEEAIEVAVLQLNLFVHQLENDD